MMKTLLAAVALAFSFSAQAETITFTGSPCSGSRDCFPVATDQPLVDVQLSARLNTRPVILVDGVAFTGTVFDQGGQPINQQVVDADGNVATLVVNFNHSVKSVQMGRARYYIQIWSVANGYFTR